MTKVRLLVDQDYFLSKQKIKNDYYNDIMLIISIIELNIAVNDLTITSISAAAKIPNLLVNRGLTLHTPHNCLSCYKMISGINGKGTPKGSPIPKSLREVMHSFDLSQGGTNKSKVLSSDLSLGTTTTNEKKISQDANSTDSKKSDALENPEEGKNNDNFVLEVIRRKEVLKLVGCMNATVGAKTAEQGLLR